MISYDSVKLEINAPTMFLFRLRSVDKIADPSGGGLCQQLGIQHLIIPHNGIYAAVLGPPPERCRHCCKGAMRHEYTAVNGKAPRRLFYHWGAKRT